MRKPHIIGIIRTFCIAIFCLLVSFFPVKTVFAETKTSSYFDFGPYYASPQKVLGITLSSLEQLPAPDVPQNVIIPTASGILPGNPFYPFEKFAENVQLTFTFNPIQKEELRLRIAAERLREAKTLADKKQYDLASDAASNYQNRMEEISHNIEGLKKGNAPGVDNFITKVEIAASSHAVVAQNLAFSSPPSVSSVWKSIIDATEEAMDSTSDSLGRPPIPEDLSSSIQELKSQGLITPEQSDKLYSFDSRKEVREELDKLANSGQFPVAETAKLDQAVAIHYPTTYEETVNILKFAELRSYQTLPPPTTEIQEKIAEWQGKSSEDVPPPPEIRPYLYTQRAEELAKSIDFQNFTAEQQTEVAKFYPQAVEENQTATPQLESNEPQTSPTPASTTLPTPTLPTAEPYIAKYTGSLPGDRTYFFKQLGEQVNLFTAFDSEKRLELSMRHAEERLREATVLSRDKNKQDLYEKTLERYKDAVENVSSGVKNFRGDEEDKKDLAEKLQAEAARHNAVLEKGILPVPGEKSEIFTAVIEATENAMDRSADVLGSPALPVSLANRLQDLKAQGLILPEEVNEITKAGAREDVREQVRKLVEDGTFPPADAKKLDEGQALVSPKDYNQFVEVRKVEELQRLRAVQAEFAQTATLKQTNGTYEERLGYLNNTIDTSLIKPKDLAGREDLLKTYRSIAANDSKRPINGGQFGNDVVPGFESSVASEQPERRDAVLGTCPIGAVLKQLEGCVWESNGKKINDYDQYRCASGREYWSFTTNKCVLYEPGSGRTDDVSPICPVGYTWSWQTQSCQAFTGGGSILPSPSPEPTPSSEEELQKRSKSCPTDSTYKPPRGCVWDENGKSVYDQDQYRCRERGQYFSFKDFTCVPAPSGAPMNEDAQPKCLDPNTRWSWGSGRCILLPEPVASTTNTAITVTSPSPVFAIPGFPLYFLKQGVETLQSTVVFTDQARQEVRLSQAKERFAEAYYLLEKKKDEEGFKKALAEYTETMQEFYNDAPKLEKASATAQKALGEKLENIAIEQNLLLQKATVIASSEVATPISAAFSVTVQGVDRAADLKGEPPLPDDVKAKIESLPQDMIKDSEKKKLLDIENRVDARIKLGALQAAGVLSQNDTAFLDKEVKEAAPSETIKVEELKKLGEIATLASQKEEIEKRVEKAEEIVKKLDEFQKTYEPGKEVPADIRPYVRLTRIEEVTQTIRPDIVDIDDFGNRKDIQLAVATLKEEFKPTKEAMRKLEDFRRANPGRLLPYELARTEALSFGLGVRETATTCLLPSPPFPANTPCPPPGAAIPVVAYYAQSSGSPFSEFVNFNQSTFSPQSSDKDGKPLVYGQGPKPSGAGSCPDGYHWMYDNGGWCMNNSGSYNNSYTASSYGGTSPGYTPYTPYYSAPGAPPASYGYQGPGTYSTYSNPANPYPYAPPVYYGSAPSYYTTNPPPGTVPGTGPSPTASGQCPAGYHWMAPAYNQAGWCMADAGTYTPSGTGYYGGSQGIATSETPPPGGYNCGSQPYDPVTKKCKDGACPGGFNWDGSKCVAAPAYSGGAYSGGSYNYYSPNLTQSSCGPGYYWDGRGCIPTYSGGSPYSSYSCTPPSSGCGGNYYWDSGSCSCRSSSSYSGGGGPSPTNSCQGISCGSGSYVDYSTCSCRTSSYYGGSSSTGSSSSCTYPSGGCSGSGAWFDWGSCSCKTTSSYSPGYNTSTSSCSYSTCGSNEWFDWGSCSCRSSSNTSSTPPGSSTSTPTSGSTSTSGSCPSGYHWMSDNGGWCMSDGGSSPSSSTTTSPAPSTTTTSTPPPTDSGSTTTSTPPPSDSGSTTTSSPPPTDSGSTSEPPPPSP